MPDVWLGRFSRWLEKLFNAKGGPLVLDVNPSLQAVVQLATGPEDLAPQAVYRFANIFGVAAGGAGVQSFIQIRNPPGSNVIAVIELLGIGPAVATQSTYHASLAAGAIDQGSPIRGFRLDARAQPLSTCVISSSSAAGADLANIILISSGTNTQGMINASFGLPLTLLPGDTIRVTDQTNNEAFTVEFLWRERALESSELT